MEETAFISNLSSFGLTRQEALIYATLLNHGELTGYEVSKETGISRSNVYSSLSAMVEKGAAYLIEGESTKYTPVDINLFLENTMNELNSKAEYLKSHAPKKIEEKEGYITITGARNIRNKIHEMLVKTELRLYIMAPSSIINDYKNELISLIENGKKIVILSDKIELTGATIYETQPEPGQLRLITDSSHVLTGELTDDDHDTCLYSGQNNLVEVMKEALKNKIILLGKN